MTGLDILPWVSAPEVFPQLETSGKADETSPNLSRPTGGRTSPSLLPPFYFSLFAPAFKNVAVWIKPSESTATVPAEPLQ